MEQIVYLLCAVTALACSVLLLRSYGRSGVRLLLWCGLFFLALTAENVILFVDLVVTGPAVDLAPYRWSIALASVFLLLIGLTGESA